MIPPEKTQIITSSLNLKQKINTLNTQIKNKALDDANETFSEIINALNNQSNATNEQKRKLINHGITLFEHYTKKNDGRASIETAWKILRDCLLLTVDVTKAPNDKTPVTSKDRKKTRRNALLTAGTWALVLELSYATFQFQTGKEGLENFGAPPGLFTTIIPSVYGALTDLYANVMSVSPKNEGDSLAFPQPSSEKEKLSSGLNTVRNICTVFSVITYTTGSLADLVGLRAVLFPHLEGWQLTLTSSSLALIIAAGGVPYYMFFNSLSEKKTFKAITEFEHAAKGDYGILRSIQAGIEYFTVTTFRSMAFAFINTQLPAVFTGNKPSLNIEIALAAFGFFSSVVNIISTRLIKTTNRWFDNRFAYLTSEHKAEAYQSLSAKDFATKRVFIELFSAISMGAGIGLLLNSLLSISNPEHQAFSIGGFTVLMLLLNAAAMVDLTINKKALEKYPDVREEYLATLPQPQGDVHSPLLSQSALDVMKQGNGNNDDSEEEEETVTAPFSPASDANDSTIGLSPASKAQALEIRKMEALKRNLATTSFAELATTFKNYGPAVGVAIIVASAQLGRMTGFLHFTDVITELSQLEFNKEAILGITLILAPPNLINQFFMFFDNVAEVALQKLAEAYVDYCVDTQQAHNHNQDHPAFENWKRWDLSTALKRYTKGICDFNIEDIEYALERRSQELTESSQEKAAGNNCLTKCWAALTGQNKQTVVYEPVYNPANMEEGRRSTSPTPSDNGQ